METSHTFGLVGRMPLLCPRLRPKGSGLFTCVEFPSSGCKPDVLRRINPVEDRSMGQHSRSFDWQGFRHFASPERAAGALIALYGEEAALAAAHCGLEAHGAGREDDFRFWVDVFAVLQAPVWRHQVVPHQGPVL